MPDKTSWWYPNPGKIAVAVIMSLVAMGIVAQHEASESDQTYSSLRRAELVQLLDTLAAESERLEAEKAELTRARDRLRTGADAAEVAEEEASRRLDDLRVLAGATPVSGPGVLIEIRDPKAKLGPELLLDAVQELRDAGAEAIELNQSVRVVANTWFGRSGKQIVVSDAKLSRPIWIRAIGDPHELAEAAKFRGGLVSTVEGPRIGGSVRVVEVASIQIDSVATVPEMRFGRPS